MHKKLIALAVAGLAAAPMFAQAQSNVTLYGRVDASWVTRTNDSRANSIDPESSNRWGMLGEEDLGGGLKAFFNLENRFYLDTGRFDANKYGDNTEFKEAAIVGLRSDTFGAISMGRGKSPLYWLSAPDGFGGDTIGTMPGRRGKYTQNWSNEVRYESNKLGPFSFTVAASPGESSAAKQVAGQKSARTRWGVSTKTQLGPVRLDIGFQKDYANDNSEGGYTPTNGGVFTAGTPTAFCPTNGDSITTATAGCFYTYDNQWKIWLMSLDYFAGPVELYTTWSWSHSFAQEKGAFSATNNTNAKSVRALVGAKVAVGNGSIITTIGRGWDRASVATGTSGSTGIYHYALGYWYNLSKRTMLLAEIANDRGTDTALALNPDTGKTKKDGQIATQIGLRHVF
ncbi:MAG: outer rane porin, OmpC family [Rhodocyclales bacterium]|nr:outer rane porin, OmpC family [Rhodocyclales bacterium]